MLTLDRRSFLHASSAFAAGFAGLRSASLHAADLSPEPAGVGYGALRSDPEGVLDLPPGFSYRVISRAGERMQDGLFVPDKPDGMATFATRDGLTILMRNHECLPAEGGGFGEAGVLAQKFDRRLIYDRHNYAPACGGVSTVVYDTQRQQVVRQFLRLAGTIRNCAGGPTPWGSWITCEETIERVGDTSGGFTCQRDHGYCFEAPATTKPGLAAPVPLVAMGRFRHEAVAVLPGSSIVYLTEDMDDGCLYRFLPSQPGRLAAGGRLQALAIVGQASRDTRNWDVGDPIAPRDIFDVRWIDLDHPESPDDDLRYRAFAAGAARFARGEGVWNCGDYVAFACTSGGSERIGQVWRYTPSGAEGQAGEADEPGRLELFIEPNDSRLVENADNLTAAPWGDLIVAEDRSGDEVRLVGVTPAGECYPLAQNHKQTEFAGVVFSPDGSTLFVNLQHAGMTVAITGPWRAAAIG
ncbi:MAG: alkaline phosphatase PhoX [Planctomycetota bacterium]